MHFVINAMKVSIDKNSSVEVIPEAGEELSIVTDSVYTDRVVVFNKISKYAFHESHFDKSTGQLIDREQRRKAFPKFEYPFDKQKIKAVIEHRFLDELNFNGYTPKGIDIETTIVTIIEKGQEVDCILHEHPVNLYPQEYHESAKRSIDLLIEKRMANDPNLKFLVKTYSTWNSEKKAAFHRGDIYFQDRMQGGYPRQYKNLATYHFSKWFMDTFEQYDDNVYDTLELIAKEFSVDTKHLREITKYEVGSPEWVVLAKETGLI